MAYILFATVVNFHCAHHEFSSMDLVGINLQLLHLLELYGDTDIRNGDHHHLAFMRIFISSPLWSIKYEPNAILIAFNEF